MADLSGIAKAVAEAEQKIAKRNPWGGLSETMQGIGQSAMTMGAQNPERYDLNDVLVAAAISGLTGGVANHYGNEWTDNRVDEFREVAKQSEAGLPLAEPEYLDSRLFGEANNIGEELFARKRLEKQKAEDALQAEVRKAGLLERAKEEGKLDAYGGAGSSSIMNPYAQEERGITSDLRREFMGTSSYKEFEKSQSGFQSLLKARADKSRVADIEFTYGAIHAIEPGLSAKDGERAAVDKSQSIPAWLKGKLKAGLSGEAVLDDNVRDAILRLASRRYDQYRNRYTGTLSGYQGRLEELTGKRDGISFLPDPGDAVSLTGDIGAEATESTESTAPIPSAFRIQPGETREQYKARLRGK